MENIETEELLKCYEKVVEYLKTLENKKKDIEKEMENAG